MPPSQNSADTKPQGTSSNNYKNAQYSTLSSSAASEAVTREYDGRFETESPIKSVSGGPEGDLILPNGRGKICYVREFLNASEAGSLLNTVQKSGAFCRTAIEFREVKFLQPRDKAFFGTKLYSYGGEQRRSIGWAEEPPASTMAHELANKIEQYSNLKPDFLNMVLVNKYSGGRDFMEWHSDNEWSMGEEPIIASVSVGAQREFYSARGTMDVPESRLMSFDTIWNMAHLSPCLASCRSSMSMRSRNRPIQTSE